MSIYEFYLHHKYYMTRNVRTPSNRILFYFILWNMYVAKIFDVVHVIRAIRILIKKDRRSVVRMRSAVGMQFRAEKKTGQWSHSD